jgi:hypothetical protein
MRHSAADWWTWNVPLSRGILLVAFGLAPLLVWTLVTENWIILGASLLVALVPVIIRWPVVPIFGLYALLACSLDAIKLLEGATLTKPVGVLAAAVLLGVGLVERRLGRPPSAAVWWCLFMLWAVLSTTWAINTEPAFKRLPSALSIFLLYLVAVSFKPSRKELYWVCVLTVLGGVLAASIGYLFGFHESAVANKVRAGISIGDQTSNPNTLGRLLILPLALAFAGVVGLRGAPRRAMAMGCAGLIGVGIYISMSRSALVSMAVVLAVLLYRIRARWQVIATIVVLLALTAMMPEQFYLRVVTMGGAEDHSAAARVGVYKLGFDALEEFGVFGAGLDNFKYAVPESEYSAHSMYLAVWVGLGIIGLVLMLVAVGCHLFSAQRAWRTGQGGVTLAALEAGCFGLVVGGLFGEVLWTKTFWLALTLLTWAIHSERRADQA